jgi:hypothetical protein
LSSSLSTSYTLRSPTHTVRRPCSLPTSVDNPRPCIVLAPTCPKPVSVCAACLLAWQASSCCTDTGLRASQNPVSPVSPRTYRYRAGCPWSPPAAPARTHCCGPGRTGSTRAAARSSPRGTARTACATPGSRLGWLFATRRTAHAALPQPYPSPIFAARSSASAVHLRCTTPLPLAATRSASKGACGPESRVPVDAREDGACGCGGRCAVVRRTVDTRVLEVQLAAGQLQRERRGEGAAQEKSAR